MTEKELLSLAKEARDKSYCPYSSVAVGAALLAKSGKVYLGANIENAAYTPTVCAERVAFFKAINDGERAFLAIAVVGGRKKSDTAPLFFPCGVCRQVMAEFCTGDFRILLENGGAQVKEYTLDSLLPTRFDGSKL